MTHFGGGGGGLKEFELYDGFILKRRIYRAQFCKSVPRKVQIPLLFMTDVDERYRIYMGSKQGTLAVMQGFYFLEEDAEI